MEFGPLRSAVTLSTVLKRFCSYIEQLLTLHFQTSHLQFKAICGNVLQLAVEYLIP